MMIQRNSEYWQQRMASVANNELNKGAEYNARIEKQYNAAIEQIESEISKWYARYAGENGITYAEAQKMLSGKELQKFRMSIEEFTAKAKSGNPQWQKQLDDAYARVRISRLESMKMQLQNIAESVSMDVEKGFPDVANAIYTDSYYRTAYEVQRGTGVGYSFARVDETKAEKLLQSPWAADGKDFSDRVWANKNQLISELQGTFTRHVITGTDPSKTIAELSERMNVSKVKAGRLVMTESAYFASAATKDSFNALGVTQYQIVATLDSHTSAVCQGLDGQVLPMKEFKEGATAPPFHVNCRCTTVPYFDDEFTEDETRASRDENDEGYIRVPADMTYPEWANRFADDDKILFDEKGIMHYGTSNGNISAMPKILPIDAPHEMYPNEISGATRGEPMSFEQIRGKINPKRTSDSLREQNCQSCAYVYELRRRGYDVVAKPYNKDGFANFIGREMRKGWIDAKTGAYARYTQLGEFSDGKSLYNQLFDKIEVGQVNTFEFFYRPPLKNGQGHVINILCEKNDKGEKQLLFYDGQCDKIIGDSKNKIVKFLNRINYKQEINLLRIDDKEIRLDVANDIAERRTK